MRRSAFTLMEMMVSITILSIMMLFLYKSYADLHKSNAYFKDKSEDVGSYLKKSKHFFWILPLPILDPSVSFIKKKMRMLFFCKAPTRCMAESTPI